MALAIDWDNYEVIEAEDLKPWELHDTIEEVREAMDHLADAQRSIPEPMQELLEQLTRMEEEAEDGSSADG